MASSWERGRLARSCAVKVAALPGEYERLFRILRPPRGREFFLQDPGVSLRSTPG
ncbi:hypothetical protein CCP3SC1_70003 [Gammaproteobacteria bacterium]